MIGAMIFSFIMGLAFSWLLMETNFLRVRLVAGKIPEVKKTYEPLEPCIISLGGKAWLLDNDITKLDRKPISPDISGN